MRNFIDTWRSPVLGGLRLDRRITEEGAQALKAGDKDAAVFEIECSLQTLGEDVRDELGLYEWNREGT